MHHILKGCGLIGRLNQSLGQHGKFVKHSPLVCNAAINHLPVGYSQNIDLFSGSRGVCEFPLMNACNTPAYCNTLIVFVKRLAAYVIYAQACCGESVAPVSVMFEYPISSGVDL